MRNGWGKTVSPPSFLIIAVALPLSLLNSGCSMFGRKAKPVPPTIVINQPIILSPPPVTQTVPAEPPVPANPPLVIPSGRNEAKNAGRSSHRRSRENNTHQQRRPGNVNHTTTDTPPAHPEAPATVPPLTPGLTPSQQQGYRNSTNALLNQARQDLGVLNGRNLSSDQVATRTQASEWVRQAQIALNQGDLVRAQNLARKAAVLTRALYEQTQ